MDKWNLIIDVENCINCNMCVLACQDEHVDNDFPNYAAPMPKHGARWIEIDRKERGQAPMIDVAYLPMLCNHCDNAPCIKAAENGAVTKRDDGIVIIDLFFLFGCFEIFLVFFHCVSHSCLMSNRLRGVKAEYSWTCCYFLC